MLLTLFKAKYSFDILTQLEVDKAYLNANKRILRCQPFCVGCIAVFHFALASNKVVRTKRDTRQPNKLMESCMKISSFS